MKHTTKLLVWSIFFILIGANIFIFISGMKVSEKITFYEIETKKLKQNNIELEKKAFVANSLQRAASVAAELKFTKKAEPYFLDNLRVALKDKE